MDSKLIILRGNSGSGKTSTSKLLQHKLGRNTMLISQDVIRREMLWVNDGEGTPAVSLLIDMVKYGRNHCKLVILEGILDAKVYRTLFEKCMEEYSLKNIYAYYFDLSFEETLRRHQMKSNRNEFGESEMRRWWSDNNYISIIHESMITQEMEQEDTINMILEDIYRT